MTELRHTIGEIVPSLYSSIAADFQYPTGVNLAGSNQCHVLSKGLWLALNARGIQSRRERHQAPNGDWHYLLAHTSHDEDPSDDDIITDLNPWQFMDRPALHLGHLHGSRAEVLGVMEQQGASKHVRSLRQLSTLSVAHTVTLMH